MFCVHLISRDSNFIIGNERHDLFCSLPYQKKHLDNLIHWHRFYLESLFQEVLPSDLPSPFIPSPPSHHNSHLTNQLVTSLAGIKKFQAKYEKYQNLHQKTMQKINSLGYLEKRSAEKKVGVITEKVLPLSNSPQPAIFKYNHLRGTSTSRYSSSMAHLFVSICGDTAF